MNKRERIKIKNMVLEALNSNSAIPYREEIREALKGYSKYTALIEEEMLNNPLKRSWILLGKLAINLRKFEEDDKKAGILNKVQFFRNEFNYYIINTEEEKDEFIEGASGGDIIELLEFEKNTNKVLEEVVKANQDIKQHEGLVEELGKRLTNYLYSSKKEIGEEVISYKKLMDCVKGNNITKGSVNRALSLDSAKANLMEYRAELLGEFKDEEKIMRELLEMTNNQISKLKKINNKEEIKEIILKGGSK